MADHRAVSSRTVGRGHHIRICQAAYANRLLSGRGRSGQSSTVTMSGKFDHWPVKCWVDGAGVSIEAGGEKGKLAVHVAADARPGVRWVRVYDEEGATSLRPFIIGTLPEIGEVEPNDDPRHPQAIGLTSATVNGRLAKRGDVDGYSVSLDQGQRLVADLEANRHLGSPMDAVLQVVSPAGFVLAQNDDAVGRDPRIVFEAPARGTFVIRLFAFPSKPDSSIRFAGGEAFIYRLTLTTGGFLEHVFPLAVSKECPATVTAIGTNIRECDRASPFPPMRCSTCSPSFIRPCRGMPWSGASPASRSSRSNPTIWLGLKNSRSTARSAAESTRQASETSLGSL